MRGRALPRFSCMMTCTSPKSLQWRKLAQGNRRSARPPAGKWRKCTPKRAFGGPSDVHFPDFLARNGAPARKQAKCTAACSVSGEVHGWLQENGRSARPPVEAFVKCSTTYNNSGARRIRKVIRAERVCIIKGGSSRLAAGSERPLKSRVLQFPVCFLEK